MNRIRNLLGFLLASVAVAFALPSSAADKVFTLGATTYSNAATPANISGVIPNGSTSILVLDFFNQSPTGNSVINSIKVTGTDPSNLSDNLTFTLTISPAATADTAIGKAMLSAFWPPLLLPFIHWPPLLKRPTTRPRRSIIARSSSAWAPSVAWLRSMRWHWVSRRFLADWHTVARQRCQPKCPWQ